MNTMLAIILDLNNDMIVDRCEWAYACVGTDFFGQVDMDQLKEAEIEAGIEEDEMFNLKDLCYGNAIPFTFDDIERMRANSQWLQNSHQKISELQE